MIYIPFIINFHIYYKKYHTMINIKMRRIRRYILDFRLVIWYIFIICTAIDINKHYEFMYYLKT